MDFYLQTEFQRCQRTGSYVKGNNMSSPFQLILEYYNFTRKMTSNLELKTTVYKSGSTQPQFVMYMRAQIKVNYKGKFYPIIKQVIYPPNFPLVPPIFSVINWDNKKYDVHDFYYHNILPDESYEVKLTSSTHFKANKDLTLMYSEFSNITAEFFPFIFRAVKPRPSVPYYFDQRYNDPNAAFPVETVTPNSQGNKVASNNSLGNDVPMHSNMNVPDSMPHAMKSFFTTMSQDLDNDRLAMEKDGETLVKRKNLLKSATQQMNDVISNINHQQTAIHTQIDGLTQQVDTMNAQGIDADSIHSFFNYSTTNGKSLLHLENSLKANLDTQYTMIDVFQEREQNPEYQLKAMNRLWNKEWDMRLTKKYIITKKLY